MNQNFKKQNISVLLLDHIRVAFETYWLKAHWLINNLKKKKSAHWLEKFSQTCEKCISEWENKSRAKKWPHHFNRFFPRYILQVMAACADKNLEYLCINLCTHLPLLQSVLSTSWEMACFTSRFDLCLRTKSPRCNSIKKWSLSQKWPFQQGLKYEKVRHIWKK